MLSQTKKIEQITALLNLYDKNPLECDGLVRVLSAVLAEYKVDHEVWVGSLVDRTPTPDRVVQPHWWLVLKLEDEWLVDYRARLWLGNEPSVPHGVFKLQDYTHFEYEGQRVRLQPLPNALFEVLTGDAEDEASLSYTTLLKELVKTRS